NLGKLRGFVDQLNDAVNQQQRTLMSTHPSRIKQVALRESGELTRLLIYVRRGLDELAQQVRTQKTERVSVSALQEVAAAINSSLELDQVLEEVMDVIIDLTKAERAMLLLIDEKTDLLEIQVARNMDQETIERSESFQISRSIVSRVAETGEPVVTMNAQEDERFSAQESIISYRLRSILCVPLKIKENITGVIYVDNRITSGIFSDHDRDLLAAFANQAAVAVENARLFQQIRRNLAEITEMKELMDNVFASIASGVITIDEGDRIALFNRAAEKILGVPANSVLQQTYEGFLHSVGLPVEPIVREVIADGGTQSAEIDVHFENRPGATTLNLTFSPLRDVHHDALGVAMVLDDVSEKKRLESVRRYLPPKLVDQIRDLDAAQRPQQRTLSVLFGDMSGFSTFGEETEPERLIRIINGYFTLAVQAITQYQGLTDKFMGDAFMALFNTPLNPQEDHMRRAVLTALLIQESLANYRNELPYDQHFHFRMGIHAGEAVVGNVGSDLRKDYSAIGDAVNLAKRLQEFAQPDQIIISQTTYENCKDWIIVESLPAVQVKGRQALEQIYTLIGLR
ncbi:MAG: adenylate/guanylate cyclase domain-containing protein, partial [Candidatus Promineifilaceae bacterium]|nr:adenylate/guanylate cyclase domain-containing protein [Candidatus Promineifilaceae bacterium]